ncbi:hypothetical protein KP78_01610 [Jeotgalibacillus soli]|uniref:Uncharacterized protein n=1 Tax=Jeotgalibacillus soli TaxID=889306 RepID=A0A0C2W5C9_9BACL|nr:hypothetical protein KP78_01610 [Jeotgalibacillus soli]
MKRARKKIGEKELGRKSEKKSGRERPLNLGFERRGEEKRGEKSEKKHEKMRGEILGFREQLIYLKKLDSDKK